MYDSYCLFSLFCLIGKKVTFFIKTIKEIFTILFKGVRYSLVFN